MDEGEFIRRAEQKLQEIDHHFRHVGARWVNPRDGGELFAALSDCARQQSGEAVDLGTARA